MLAHLNVISQEIIGKDFIIRYSWLFLVLTGYYRYYWALLWCYLLIVDSCWLILINVDPCSFSVSVFPCIIFPKILDIHIIET